MSNQPQISLNFIPNEPQLADLLATMKKDIFLSLSCHHIGTVQSFNAENQTVKATINYSKTYFQLDIKTGIYNPVQLDYPILIDCPAIVLGGGDTFLSFPIQQGDECLILFNDRDIDNWFSGASSGPVASTRLHSFSDGIALIGLRSLPNKLPDYDTTRAALRDKRGAMVAVGGANGTKVKIANSTTDLNTLLQNLIAQIEALTVICATPGSPSSVPVNAAAFATIATQLGTLLE